jgi:hypothetical protein
MRAIDVARLALAIIGVISLMLAPVLAFVRRPSIEIEAHDWNGAVPWRLAAVWIRNKPPPRWLPLASRDAALACRVTARFYHGSDPVTPPIPCRWSDRPEPIKNELVDPQTLGAPAGPPVLIGIPDPQSVPETQVYDLLAGARREEVAVAVLCHGEAYGWGAESYLHHWRHPDWKLERGAYDVEIRAEWQGTSVTKWLRLEYPSDDLAQFRLAAAERTK